MTDNKIKLKSFVIMPFASDYNDIFKIGIKATAYKQDVLAYRLDEELFDQGMLDKIYNEINQCDFLIADLSDKNPNVFYELGYAHAKDKLCILITKNVDNIPFDLKHMRHIVYGQSISFLQEQLEKNIIWAKKEVTMKKNNPFKVELKPSGSLVNTKVSSEANFEFKIDIENLSEKNSPEIHSIYLHTSTQWEIKKEGKLLSYKPSDIKNYTIKYQFQPDLTIIPRKGWTQIKLNLVKVISYSWEGKEFKDKYSFNGTIYIQIVTEKEIFDFPLPISLEIDTLPF